MTPNQRKLVKPLYARLYPLLRNALGSEYPVAEGVVEPESGASSGAICLGDPVICGPDGTWVGFTFDRGDAYSTHAATQPVAVVLHAPRKYGIGPHGGSGAPEVNQRYQYTHDMRFTPLARKLAKRLHREVSKRRELHAAYRSNAAAKRATQQTIITALRAEGYEVESLPWESAQGVRVDKTGRIMVEHYADAENVGRIVAHLDAALANVHKLPAQEIR